MEDVIHRSKMYIVVRNLSTESLEYAIQNSNPHTIIFTVCTAIRHQQFIGHCIFLRIKKEDIFKCLKRHGLHFISRDFSDDVEG